MYFSTWLKSMQDPNWNSKLVTTICVISSNVRKMDVLLKTPNLDRHGQICVCNNKSWICYIFETWLSEACAGQKIEILWFIIIAWDMYMSVIVYIYTNKLICVAWTLCSSKPFQVHQGQHVNFIMYVSCGAKCAHIKCTRLTLLCTGVLLKKLFTLL